MRENLLGYLLNALEPDERQAFEDQLARDPQLQSQVQNAAKWMPLLAADNEPIEPPPGLAERTCNYVSAQVVSRKAELGPTTRGRWSMADMLVAAALFLAASLLFFPALGQSRFAAQVTGCKNNLMQIGKGFSQYSQMHDGYFPAVPAEGPLAAAGIYGPILREQGYLTECRVLICPATELAAQAGEFHVPSCAELRAMAEADVNQSHKRMGGSYGYHVGFISDNRYCRNKDQHRPTFALVADAPSSSSAHVSLNHGAHGQNVLFEDGHVLFITTGCVRGCDDNIFVNDDGEVAPGKHQHDSVIAPGHFRILLPAKVIIELDPGK